VRQILRRHSFDRRIDAGLRRKEVDGEPLDAQFDRVPVGEQPGIPWLVDNRPDLGEAPTQCPARIIGHIPEHVTKLLPPVRTPGQGEIAEQGARLA
jgi:hypothetical protein